MNDTSAQRDKVLYLHHEAYVSLGRWSADNPPRWAAGVTEAEFHSLFEAAAARLGSSVTLDTRTESAEHFELAPEHRRVSGKAWITTRVVSPPVAVNTSGRDTPCAVACVCTPDAVSLPPEPQRRALLLASRAHDPYATDAARAGTPFVVRRHERRTLAPVTRHEPWSWRVEFATVNEIYRGGDNRRLCYEITLRCRCPPGTTSAEVAARCAPSFHALSTSLGADEAEVEQTLLARYLRDAV